MQIANGIEILEISANVMGKAETIHPTLIWDDETVILVDTGFPGQLSKIREAMEKAKVSFDKLNKIILTHQDIDHIGSLPDILNESTQKIEVMANELEKPYIQGEKRLIKFESLDLDSLPEELGKKLKPIIENPPKAKVDRTVADGEELPYCGGIIIIHTPGHTPGHISLYHKQSKTLIAGDALFVADCQLIGPKPQYTLDMNLAKKSLAKLCQYDIEKVICYHGGLYMGNANQRIAELSNKS
jgi:glyoxylase-like metal-dependent hydrolase (beta-lactamase superfamily II)